MAMWDVVVDDPERLARHEIRGLEADVAEVAHYEAQRIVREREGNDTWRGNTGPRDSSLFTETAPAGQHPRIDYSKPAEVIVLDGATDPQSGLPTFRRDTAKGAR